MIPKAEMPKTPALKLKNLFISMGIKYFPIHLR
jgi:hypothetical protein